MTSINVDSDSSDNSEDSSSQVNDFFNKKRKRENFSSDDEKEEVLPLTDDESLKQYNSNVSDFEGDSENEADSYNVQAWGRKKSLYYNADFVDEDRGRTYRDEDNEAAKAEEFEALEIHKKFLENIKPSTFESFAFSNKTKNLLPEEEVEEAAPDWSAINKNDKLKILTKNSPEFIPSLTDFKEMMVELKEKILPLIHSMKDETVKKYWILKSQLILHYCMNVSFYTFLKSQGKPESSHPVRKRLATDKMLLNFSEQFDAKFDPNVNVMLNNQQDINEQSCEVQENDESVNVEHEQSAVLRQKSSGEGNARTSKHLKEKLNGDTEVEKEVMSLYMEMKKKQKESKSAEVAMDQNDDVEQYDREIESSELQSKRSITYQIAKNKGLMPKRKKECRNPRVKHRVKFRKANIKRKGQVRVPRTETQRYGGELSGIRTNVSRSIKIK